MQVRLARAHREPGLQSDLGVLPPLHVVQHEHVPCLPRERSDRPLEVQRGAGPRGGHRPGERLQVVGKGDVRLPPPPLATSPVNPASSTG